jgi:succinate dehydrogenase hydrophobic anchor subunit
LGSIEAWVESLRKNWRQRLSAICLVLAIIVLIDEIVKEGYTVDLHDFTTWPPFTHEQLFLLLLALGLLLGLRR